MNRLYRTVIVWLILIACVQCKQKASSTSTVAADSLTVAKKGKQDSTTHVPVQPIDSVFNRFQKAVSHAALLKTADCIYFPLPGSELCASQLNTGTTRITEEQFPAAFDCLFSQDARSLIAGATMKENLHPVDTTGMQWETDFGELKKIVNTRYPVYELYFEYAHTNESGHEKGRYYGYIFGVVNNAYKLCMIYRSN